MEVLQKFSPVLEDTSQIPSTISNGLHVYSQVHSWVCFQVYLQEYSETNFHCTWLHTPSQLGSSRPKILLSAKILPIPLENILPFMLKYVLSRYLLHCRYKSLGGVGQRATAWHCSVWYSVQWMMQCGSLQVPSCLDIFEWILVGLIVKQLMVMVMVLVMEIIVVKDFDKWLSYVNICVKGCTNLELVIWTRFHRSWVMYKAQLSYIRCFSLANSFPQKTLLHLKCGFLNCHSLKDSLLR